eukprot:m.219409 g.219409  ORF g.219409 m.219409 type:complete len:79 (+) comp26285_c0_seq6:140-376(+)
MSTMRCYLLDHGVAESIVNRIDRIKPLQGATIIQPDPAPGLLSAALLDKDIKKLIAIEPTEAMYKKLMVCQQRIPGQK